MHWNKMLWWMAAVLLIAGLLLTKRSKGQDGSLIKHSEIVAESASSPRYIKRSCFVETEDTLLPELVIIPPVIKYPHVLKSF
jgi:hypothetical protein